MPQFDARFFAGEIIWTLISFALLFVLLRWLVLPRLTAAINERTRAISEEIEQAKKLREEAEALKSDYRRKLDAADKDAKQLFDKADAAVLARHRQVMNEWRAEMKRRETEFRDETEIAKQQALRDIRRHAAELVSETAERLIHERTDSDSACKLIDEAVDEIEHAEHRRH